MEKQVQNNTKEQSSNDSSEDGKGELIVSYSAPLPPPAMFAQYNSVVPNAAERILVMAEKQSKHRHFIEKLLIVSESSKSLIGLIFAFITVLSGLGVGAYLILNDKEITGLISMFTPLGVVAGLFIYREKSKEKED